MLLAVVGVVLFWPPQASGWLPLSLALGAGALALMVTLNPRSGQAEDLTLTGALFLSLLAWVPSILLSANPGLGLNRLNTEVACAIVFLVTAWAVTPERALPAFRVLVLVGAGLSLIAIDQVLLGFSHTGQRLALQASEPASLTAMLLERLRSGRAFAWLPYPNAFAGLIAMLIPLNLGLLLKKENTAWVWRLTLGLLGLGLWLSGSWGGWLAAGIGVALWWWGAQEGPGGTRRWVGPVITALVFLGGAIALAAVRGWPSFWASGWARITDDWMVLTAIPSRVWFGIGPGQFESFFAANGSIGHALKFAHSSVVQRFSETGVLGLLTWLAFLGLAGRAVWPAIRGHQLGLALGAGLIAGFVHALGDVDLALIKNSVGFYFLLGTAVGLGRALGPTRRAEPNGWLRPIDLKPLIFAGLTLVLLCSTWQGARSTSVLMGAGLLLLATLLLWSWSRSAAFPLGDLGSHPLDRNLAWIGSIGLLSVVLSPAPFRGFVPLVLLGWGIVLYAFVAWFREWHRAWLWLLLGSSVSWSLAGMISATQVPEVRLQMGWPNPNLLAAFLAAGGITGLTWFWFAQDKLERLAGLTAGIVNTLALCATGSLAGVLNLVAGTMIGLGTGNWKKIPPRRWWITGLLAVGLCLVPTVLRLRIGQLPDQIGPLSERWGLAQAAVQMSMHRPLWGYGLGTYGDAFHQFQFPNLRGFSRFGKSSDFAHSEPLQVAAETGWVGALVLALFLWQLARRWSRMRLPPGPPLAQIAAWGALAGAGMQACLDFNWHLPGLFLWGMVFLGIIRGQEDPLTETNLQTTAPLRNPTPVLLACALLLLGQAALRPIWSQKTQAQAGRWLEAGKWQAAESAFEQAVILSPLDALAYDGLGRASSALQADPLDPRWAERSRWAFQRAGALNSLDPFIPVHWARAGKMFQPGDPHLGVSEVQRIETHYLEAIRLAPHHAPFYFELGNFYRQSGRLREAEKGWLKAVELEPNYARAWVNLGVAKEIRGDALGAAQGYRTALQVQRYAAQAQGDYERALLLPDEKMVQMNLKRVIKSPTRN